MYVHTYSKYSLVPFICVTTRWRTYGPGGSGPGLCTPGERRRTYAREMCRLVGTKVCVDVCDTDSKKASNKQAQVTARVMTVVCMYTRKRLLCSAKFVCCVYVLYLHTCSV